MSLKKEGCSCVRCKAYLFEEDDVVYCPVCGAPHHRDCYDALGHCALEELHGTELEYSPEKVREANEKAEEKREAEKTKQEAEKQINKTVCNMCGESYEAYLDRCPKCSAPNFLKVSGFEGFDFLGGVPADYKIAENVTADDVKKFVASNTHRYVPKFATMNSKNKVSWNWMAFLFPCQWMFSRKMFKNGIIVGILSIMVTLLSVPLATFLESVGGADVTNAVTMAEILADALPTMEAAPLILTLIGFLLNIGIRLFSAIFGDYFYKKHTVAAVQKIKLQSEDIASDYRKYGGVNLLWFLIATMALNYIPMLLIAFI